MLFEQFDNYVEYDDPWNDYLRKRNHSLYKPGGMGYMEAKRRFESDQRHIIEIHELDIRYIQMQKVFEDIKKNNP